MSRSDLAAFLDDDVFATPPIASRAHPAGKVYTIASPDAATGLKLTALANLGTRAHYGVEVTDADIEALDVTDGQEADLYRMTLGAAYDQMVADGVSWVKLQRLGRYMFLRFAMSQEAADTLLGEAPAPNRAARRARKGSETSTRSRGSTSGTTSRRKTSANT